MTPPAPSYDTRKAALLVGFMWVAYFLNYADRQAVSAIRPSLKDDLGMSDKEFGLAGAIFLWVYAFGNPISGQLGDRFSKRALVVWSLIIWSVATVATGLATSVAVMLTLRAAMGISESLFMPTAIALTASVHPPEYRSRAVATLMTAQIAGIIAGASFAGWMADRGLWRGAFFVLGAIGVLYSLPYFLFLRRVEEPPRDTPSEAGNSLALTTILKIPSYLLLCLAFSVLVFGLWLLYGWLPDFLHTKFSLNQADAAYNATAFAQIATAVGLIGGGFVADKLYTRSKSARLWLSIAGLLFCAPCLHALGNCESLVSTRIAAAGFGLFSGLVMGNIFPTAFEVVPGTLRASAVGMLNFFGAIISGFAPLVGGIWKQSPGIARLLTFTGIAYAIAAIALMLGAWLCFARDRERFHGRSSAT